MRWTGYTLGQAATILLALSQFLPNPGTRHGPWQEAYRPGDSDAQLQQRPSGTLLVSGTAFFPQPMPTLTKIPLLPALPCLSIYSLFASSLPFPC